MLQESQHKIETYSQHHPFGVLLFASILAISGILTVFNVFILANSFPLGVFLSIPLAFVPLIVLFLYFSNLRVMNFKHQTKMILYSFLWGSLGATGIAIVLNTIALNNLPTIVGISIFAPFTEEFLKGVFLIGILYLSKNAITSTLDAVVYAGFIAAGFAFTENISYFTTAYSGVDLASGLSMPGGFESLAATFVARGLITFFAHPMFSLVLALFIGLSLKQDTRLRKNMCIITGLFLSMIVHGLWNFSTVQDGKFIVIVYSIVFIPLLFGLTSFGMKEKEKEGLIVEYSIFDLGVSKILSNESLKLLSPKEAHLFIDHYKNKALSYHGLLAKSYIHHLQGFFLYHKNSLVKELNEEELRYAKRHYQELKSIEGLLNL